MRLLLVGAFAYPHAQGSQVYFQEQARALRNAGAEVELLTYGPGPDPEAQDARDDFVHTAIPAWAAPRSRRSGPQLDKPVADLALALALRRSVRRAPESAASSNASKYASRTASSPASRQRAMVASWPRVESFRLRHDAILVHHIEAALAALHFLPRPRPPIVYCAHTLLEHELPTYFKSLTHQGSCLATEDHDDMRPEHFSGAPARLDAQRERPRSIGAAARALATTGRLLDTWVARRADAWLALTQTSARVMSERGGRPGQLIWPPIAEPPPRVGPTSAGESDSDAAIVRAQGLEPGRYFLYTGNLDPYQDLDLLEALATTRPHSLPIVVATHAERATAPSCAIHSGTLRVLPIRSAAEACALTTHARATLVPRRSPGGFPIKLVNSLAVGTPAVVFQPAEWGLEAGRDCLAGELERPVASFAAALDRLESDAALVERLGQGARASYLARHTPARAAADSLALIERVAEHVAGLSKT